MDITDTYVICCTGPRHLWIAYSLKTCQIGTGMRPKEALADAIEAADQAMESATEPRHPHRFKSATELILSLAKIAQPMTGEECTPGVVYKYERIVDSSELG